MAEISTRARAHIRSEKPSGIPFLEASITKEDVGAFRLSEDKSRPLGFLERVRPSGEKLLNLEPDSLRERKLDIKLHIYQMETDV